MSYNSVLLNSQEVLNLGPCIAGNKAYNLSVLKHLVNIKNIPDSLSLGCDIAQEDEIIKKVVQEISSIWKYPIIVRSSTNVEDSSISFAGMFVSKICYDDIQLECAIFEVLKTKNEFPILRYSQIKGIEPSMIKVSVLFQPYLLADISGVLFTKNPLSGKPEVLVEYKEDTTDAVTSGTSRPQTLIINNCSPWPFNELYLISQQAEAYWGVAVDIEWIVANDKLWIVQIRQITT